MEKLRDGGSYVRQLKNGRKVRAKSAILQTSLQNHDDTRNKEDKEKHTDRVVKQSLRNCWLILMQSHTLPLPEETTTFFFVSFNQ